MFSHIIYIPWTGGTPGKLIILDNEDCSLDFKNGVLVALAAAVFKAKMQRLDLRNSDSAAVAIVSLLLLSQVSSCKLLVGESMSLLNGNRFFGPNSMFSIELKAFFSTGAEVVLFPYCTSEAGTLLTASSSMKDSPGKFTDVCPSVENIIVFKVACYICYRFLCIQLRW